LYILLSGNVFAVPATSAGLAQVEGIVSFTSYLMSDEESQQTSLDNHVDSNPQCEFDLHEFSLSKIDDIMFGFASFGISINNPKAFPKGSNIRKEQVERCLAHIKTLEKVDVGIFNRLSQSLKATQVALLVKLFIGEQKSYISNRRDLDKQLFKDCFSSSTNNALINPFRRGVMAAIDKEIVVFDTDDVVLCVETGDGEIKEVQLRVGHDKTDLAEYARTKGNGTKYLDVKCVKICIKRKGKTGVFEVFWNRAFECNFANSNIANPLVNPDAVRYAAGFVSVHLVNGEYSIMIPVTEHLIITAPTNVEMFVFPSNFLGALIHEFHLYIVQFADQEVSRLLQAKLTHRWRILKRIATRQLQHRLQRMLGNHQKELLVDQLKLESEVYMRRVAK
jgi:hypothetical protein